MQPQLLSQAAAAATAEQDLAACLHAAECLITRFEWYVMQLACSVLCWVVRECANMQQQLLNETPAAATAQ
jgi:hypothetical protein